MRLGLGVAPRFENHYSRSDSRNNFKSGHKLLDYNMFTTFHKDLTSTQIYYKLNSSFQITSIEYQSSTLKFAGLYAIFKGDICYYVGQSQNLASRISQHITGKYNSCDRVSVYLAKSNGFSKFDELSKETRKSILESNELYLMKMLSPIENLITPKPEFILEESKVFDMLLDDNYEKNPCISIIIDEEHISVSSEYEQQFYGVKSLNSHNKFVIEFTDGMGKDKAIEEFIHG